MRATADESHPTCVGGAHRSPGTPRAGVRLRAPWARRVPQPPPPSSLGRAVFRLKPPTPRRQAPTLQLMVVCSGSFRSPGRPEDYTEPHLHHLPNLRCKREAKQVPGETLSVSCRPRVSDSVVSTSSPPASGPGEGGLLLQMKQSPRTAGGPRAGLGYSPRPGPHPRDPDGAALIPSLRRRVWASWVRGPVCTRLRTPLLAFLGRLPP